MTPFDTPAPALIQRVTHIERISKLDSIVRRLALLDAKLNVIDRALLDLGDSS